MSTKANRHLLVVYLIQKISSNTSGGVFIRKITFNIILNKYVYKVVGYSDVFL